MQLDFRKLATLLEEMVSQPSDSGSIIYYPSDNGTRSETVPLAAFPLPIENGGKCVFQFHQFRKRPELIKHLKDTGRLPRCAVNIHLLNIGVGGKYLPCDFRQIRHKDKLDACVTQLLDSGRKGLVLAGDYGTGKTTMMRYIAEQLLTKSNCRIRPPHIRTIRTSRLYTLIMDPSKRELVEEIEKKHYLIIDDFGRTYEVEYANNRFEDILSYRYDNRLPTFITTNMDLREPKIQKHPVWGRVVDLFRDRDWMFDAFVVGGKSMRGENNAG